MTPALELAPSGVVSESGIPIRNIWYLMAYASDATTKLTSELASAEDFLDDLPDLVARLLVDETRLRIWGNLTVGYRQMQSELSRLRGTVSHIQTVRRNSFARGQIVCKYEEITLDTMENRLVRTALRALTRMLKDPDAAVRCKATEAHLAAHGVGLLPQRGGLMALGRIPANPRDARMCALAILALQMEIPLQESGSRALHSPTINDYWLRSLFEKAIYGFYRYHLSGRGWSVRGGRILYWDTSTSAFGSSSFLPIMKTDIELIGPTVGQKTVIDTKFADIRSTGRFGDESLQSGYIYQLYTYLRSQEKSDDGASLTSTGMLLHPAVGNAYYKETIIQGHRFRFATVDLSDKSQEISSQLLNLMLEPEIVL
jgi:5-methylcytosine-specific restriction enzyme subunit McrC